LLIKKKRQLKEAEAVKKKRESQNKINFDPNYMELMGFQPDCFETKQKVDDVFQQALMHEPCHSSKTKQEPSDQERCFKTEVPQQLKNILEDKCGKDEQSINNQKILADDNLSSTSSQNS